MNVDIVPLTTHGPLFEGAIRVYGNAFAEPPYSDPDRGVEIRDRLRDVHSRRAGFRGFIATDPETGVVGMIYGYHGARGQWWHDSVARYLSRQDAEDWLGDSYELVELAVDPKCQRRGVGTLLIGRLLEGAVERTCVLSTRVDSDAHRLYAREGFETVQRMPFVSGGAEFYIMGKRLR